MATVVGLVVTVAVLAVIGLIRATADYGYAGFIAWLEILLGPAVSVAAVIFLVYNRQYDKGLRALLPSDRALRILGIGVAVVTCIGLALSASVGVGWVVSK